MIIKAGKALVLLFPPSGSSLGRGMVAKPHIKHWQISDIYYLKSLCEYWKNFEFEMFSNCADKHLKFDIQTCCVYMLSSKLTS